MKTTSTMATLWALCLALIVPAEGAAQTQPGPAFSEWSNLAGLRSGRTVSIHRFKGLGPKLKGVFLRADEDGVVFFDDNGVERRVQRTDIRRIKARRENHRGMWIGAATGAAAMGLTVSRKLAASSDDPGLPGHILVIGVGAAFGALVGILFDRSSVVVYEAPKPRSGPTKDQNANNATCPLPQAGDTGHAGIARAASDRHRTRPPRKTRNNSSACSSPLQ